MRCEPNKRKAWSIKDPNRNPKPKSLWFTFLIVKYFLKSLLILAGVVPVSSITFTPLCTFACHPRRSEARVSVFPGDILSGFILALKLSLNPFYRFRPIVFPFSEYIIKEVFGIVFIRNLNTMARPSHLISQNQNFDCDDAKRCKKICAWSLKKPFKV